MKINEIVQVECSDLTHDGLGVCKIDGFPIFVFDMMEGEIADIQLIRLDKTYGYGKVVKMIQLSLERVTPKCPLFGICGGCDIMHMSYKKQLSFKKNMVLETLKRIGKIENPPVEEILGMDIPYYYRNKVQVPFQNQGQKVICGFYKRKSHDVVAFEECFIQTQESSDLVIYIRDLMNLFSIPAYDESTHRGVMRHVLVRNTSHQEYMVVFITRSHEIRSIEQMIQRIVKKFPNVKSIIQNINNVKTNVILGEKYIVLYGEETLIETLCGLDFRLSYPSFFQVNPIQTEKLYNKILEYAAIDSTMTVLDAYCGVGTISLLLAQKAKKVYGIEIVLEAIIDANHNAGLNNITNVEFITGKSEEKVFEIEDSLEVVVVDPPRKGCDKLFLDAMIEKNIPKIVYVSCNIATFARDAKYLSEYYDIVKTTLVDLFPHISEVESVSLLVHKES